MAEIIQITETYSRGNASKKMTTLIQEWLCIHNLHTKIDGDYGPATEASVQKFQSRNQLPITGKVNPACFSALTKPLSTVMALSQTATQNYRQTLIRYARKYLQAHPIEVGGQNMGPWVRYFMDGHQGNEWPWCAGFVTLLTRQSARDMGQTSPVERTYSCDVLGTRALDQRILIRGNRDNISLVRPGDIFLVRRTPRDWTHTGIVTEVFSDHCVTIEGNTNDEGSREGYEVCQRIRAYSSLDFIGY